MDSESQKPVSVGPYSIGENASLTLNGLTSEESEKMQGMLRGHWWARGNGDRIDFVHGMETPPAPMEDTMLPQWRPISKEDQEGEYQLRLLDSECDLQNRSPSILIQHLCGYGYSPDGYKRNAEQLEKFGFTCMRSRRGNMGEFLEIWFLPGLWAAEGILKEAIRDMRDGITMDKVMRFISRHVSFGTLDIAVQRMCQVLD